LALSGAAAHAAAETSTDLYWHGQRAEIARHDEEAIAAYRRLLSRLPDSAVASSRLFDAALRTGNIAEALRAQRAAVLAGSADGDAQLLFFVEAFRARKWDVATNVIAQLEREGDFAFMVPVMKGLLEQRQTRSGGLDLDDLRESPLAAFYADDQLIYADLVAGRLKQAQMRLRAFRGFDEPHGRALALYAIAAMKTGGEADFAAALERQIGVEADHPQAGPVTPEIALAAQFSRLAHALAEQKQPEKGLYFARLAYWVAPTDDAAKLALAEMLAKQGAVDAAQAMLTSITESSAFWMAAVGVKLEITADPAKALAVATAASTARPDAKNLKLFRARALEQAGDRAAAIAIYRDLTAPAGNEGGLRPRAYVYLMLASALDAQGQWPDARAALEQALQIEPANPQALNYLGYSLLERREDIARGFALVSRAHQLAPQSAAIADSLGWAYFLTGDVEKAIPLLEVAAQAEGGDVAINEHLGDAYWRVGRRIEARFAWRAAAVQASGATSDRLTRKIDLGWSEEVAAP
jgi:tetratricopeptide (TPR) repeat protein